MTPTDIEPTIIFAFGELDIKPDVTAFEAAKIAQMAIYIGGHIPFYHKEYIEQYGLQRHFKEST